MASVEAPGSASRDRQGISASSASTAPTTPGSAVAAARGARRSLAKDLRAGDSNLEACSPRMLNRKLLLLQQQASEQQQQHHHHRLQQQQQQAMNMAAAVLLNSRRVYPSSSRQQSLDSAHRVRGSSWDLSSDCSNHGSPVVAARRVPKKMVVDEKQLALRLMRARSSAQALASSSSSSSSSASSSSSSENASLRASAEDSSRRASYAAELVRRGLLGGSLSRQQQQQLLRQGSASSSGGSLGSPESRRAPGNGARVEEKQALMPCAATGCSGRSSDAEESSRPRPRSRSGGAGASEEEKSALVSPAATLLRSTSSASSSKLRLKAADMAAAMQEHAFQCAQEVLDGMDKLQCKRVAWELKKEFDKTYGPAWHCIVGTSFGSYVTHSVGGFLYFSIGKVSVLLFQTAVELIEHH